jgi:serine/threonine protein kinase
MVMAERPTEGGPRPSSPGARKPLLVVGERLGSYVVEERLGAGGMAEVYRGRHTSLDKKVAIKVLFPELAANEDLRERFLREGRAASRIDHPHIVNVTDVGKDGDRVFLVMELLEGETLGDLMTREVTLAPARILDCLIPVIAAVGAGHKNGVVHRDLKPENVFLARDLNGRPLPKVLDFGVSKLEGTSLARVTATESVLGTPHYMSPEQARGRRDVDGRTDQYAIGVILYEALVGRLPYDGTTAIELIHEVAAGPVRSPRAFTSSIPDELEAVLMKALANAPEERFSSMEALGLALLPFATERTQEGWRRALEGTVTPSVPPPSATDTKRPSTGRNRADLRTAPHRKAPSADRVMPPTDASAPETAPRDSDVRESEPRTSGVRPSEAPRPNTPTASAASPAPAVSTKPEPSRPIALYAALAIVPILAVGAWLALRPTPTVSHTFSLDPAATVYVDGVEVGHGELVTFSVPDDDQAHDVQVQAHGYDNYRAHAPLSALPPSVELSRVEEEGSSATPPEVVAPVAPQPPEVVAPEPVVPEVVPELATPPSHAREPRTPRVRRPVVPEGHAPPPRHDDLRMER